MNPTALPKFRPVAPARRSILAAAGVALAAAGVALATCAATASAQFDALYAFGDSLSDVGNVQAKTTALSALGVPVTPGPSYFNGRFSNGPNFIDGLSAGLGLGSVLPSVIGGGDYAHGGARTTGTPFPGSAVVDDVDDQVTTFLASNLVADAGALYVVFAGANDLTAAAASPTPDAATPAAALAAQVGRLYDAGARQFLLPNLPSLGLIPRFNADPAASAGAAGLTAQFNAALASALDSVESTRPDLVDYRLDVAGLFADLVADRAAFGLTNVTDPAAPGLSPGDANYDASRVVSDPDQYLFWDDLHPTAAGHALLASAALESLAAVPEPGSMVVIVALPALCLRRRRHAVA